MMTGMMQRILLLLMLWWGSWAAWAATAVPALTAPVMDTAQMMSASERQQLNEHLLQYSEQHGSQIVVLTVPSIAPETPFDYATRVMQQWQLGRTGVDDGVLLLLVRNERKTHLAVGRGLEGAIPDVYAKRILEDVLRPYLAKGKMDEGIVAAVSQVEKLIAGESLPEPTAVEDDEDTSGVLAFLFVLPLLFSALFKALFGRVLGSLVAGGLMFGAALLIGLGYTAAAVCGVICAGLALFFDGNALIAGGGGSGGSGRGGNSGGWGSGGSSGNGRSGGGGFSGGGGRFGGGGASGGW